MTARAAAPGPCVPACRRRCSPTRGTRRRPRPDAARPTAAAGARCHCPGRARSARDRGLGSEAGMGRPVIRALGQRSAAVPSPAGRSQATAPQHFSDPALPIITIQVSFTPVAPQWYGAPNSEWTLGGPAHCIESPAAPYLKGVPQVAPTAHTNLPSRLPIAFPSEPQNPPLLPPSGTLEKPQARPRIHCEVWPYVRSSTSTRTNVP